MQAAHNHMISNLMLQKPALKGPAVRGLGRQAKSVNKYRSICSQKKLFGHVTGF